MAFPFAAIGLAISGLAAVGQGVLGFMQIDAQKDAEKKAEEMRLLQQKRRTAGLLAARNRAAAEVEAAGVAGGVEGSAVQGALASLNSQATGQMGFNSQIEAGQQAITGIQQDIRGLDQVSSTLGAVGRLGSRVGNALQGQTVRPTAQEQAQAMLQQYNGSQGAAPQSSLTPGLRTVAKGGKVSRGFNTNRRDINDPFGLSIPGTSPLDVFM